MILFIFFKPMANVNRPKSVLSNWGITENYGFYQNDKTTNMGQT